MSQSNIAVPLYQTLHWVFNKARCRAQYFFFRILMTCIDPLKSDAFCSFADDTTV